MSGLVNKHAPIITKLLSEFFPYSPDILLSGMSLQMF